MAGNQLKRQLAGGSWSGLFQKHALHWSLKIQLVYVPVILILVAHRGLLGYQAAGVQLQISEPTPKEWGRRHPGASPFYSHEIPIHPESNRQKKRIVNTCGKSVGKPENDPHVCCVFHCFPHVARLFPGGTSPSSAVLGSTEPQVRHNKIWEFTTTLGQRCYGKTTLTFIRNLGSTIIYSKL